MFSIPYRNFCRILTFVVLAGAAGVNCQAVEAKQTCLFIEHVTSTHGAVSTYVTTDSVKLVFRNINGYLLARAPAWKVVLVNLDAKLIYEDDYKHWTSRLISHSYMGPTGDQCDLAMRKAQKKNYAGRECSLYLAGTNSDLANYVVIEPSVVPVQGCRILEKWFGTPFMDAVPVAYSWNHNGESSSAQNRKIKPSANTLFNDHIDCLQTRMIKDAVCPQDFFSYPRGLTKVNSEVDIFATKKQAKELEDALHDLSGQ